MMEKNHIKLSTEAAASGDYNLYPNLSYIPAVKSVQKSEEAQEKTMEAGTENNVISGYGIPQPKPQEEKTKWSNPEIIKKTGFASFLYAVFFTFCLYKNWSGITFPFYVAGTVCFCIYIIRKSDCSWKGEHISALAASLLLGISTCLTDNEIIILMNKVWLLALFFYFLLAVYFDTKKWQLGKFLEAMLGMIGVSIGNMFGFFPDMKAWMEERKNAKNMQTFYVFIGLLISVPLIAVVLMLLSSADLVFRKSMDTLFGNIKGWDIFCCILWTIAIFLFSYGMTTLLYKRELNETVKDRRTGQPVIAISATAVIAVIYIYFCVIQVVYLFAGNGMLPDGYTYAQYARQGFFQLLFVCLLNLGLVLAGLGFFRESKALKGILLIISLCTFIMIASSFYRMMLYISAYCLTFLRIFVLWALCVIALLMAGVIGKTFMNGFPLFQYGLAVISCCYLVLSFAQPDYWIARYNMAHMAATETDGQYYFDTWYLTGLSADAAPVIITPERIAKYEAYKVKEKENIREGSTSGETAERPWYFEYMERQKRKAEDMTLRTYNFSRGYVRKLFLENTSSGQ